MSKSKTLMLGVAALSGGLSSPVIAQNLNGDFRGVIAGEAVSVFSDGEIVKSDPNCPQEPILKKLIEPVLKVSGVFENTMGTDKAIEPMEVIQGLRCLNLIEAHITKNGIYPLSEDQVSAMEQCLDLFSQELLEN